MMFYEAAGGIDFAGLPNQFQSYVDLSRALALDRAVLVAEADGPGSQLVDAQTGKPLGDSARSATVVYRFVLPVARRE
jgi:hypothetical protein